jgi:RNA polymerase sigma factor (sigma-70 family)
MPASKDEERALSRLAAGSLRGDPRRAWRSFEVAWPFLVPWIGSVLRARRLAHDLSEDAGQAALLRVWSSRMDFRGHTTGELLGWVRVIVLHEAARLTEARRRRPEIEDEGLPEPAAEDTTSGTATERDTLRALEECLEKLPASEREVIEHLYSRGAPSERDTAAVLGRSKTRVNALRSSGLVRLAGCLRGKGVEA